MSFSRPALAMQLAFLEPALVDHIMILDAGDGDREIVAGMLLDDVRIGEQGDGLRLPFAPRLGGGELHGRIVAGQAAVIGGDQVAALGLRGSAARNSSHLSGKISDAPYW